VQAARATHRPLCLVHESDPDKNGTPLDELVAGCPAELRAFIFEGRRPLLPWLRLRDFQLVTLISIAEQLLLHSPAYSGHAALPLKVAGDVRELTIRLERPVLLYASRADPGATEVATELQGCVEANDGPSSRRSRASSSAGDEESTRAGAGRRRLRGQTARRRARRTFSCC